MAKLPDWFDVIEESGNQMRKDQEETRRIIDEKGPPDAVCTLDKDYEIRVWKVDGGVATVRFRDGKADLDSIEVYSDDYIDALVKAKEKR